MVPFAIFSIVLALLLAKHPLPVKGIIRDIKIVHERAKANVPSYLIYCGVFVYLAIAAIQVAKGL